ncbi:hypothetical protein Enr10x_00660 [Gimesia panareensis]|uniref:DUF6314 domain-containing protein n=1 Tax=Gimesia panareensis TaxID=2527978 RepID=A0A517PZG9_9PLAN|nr:DUF6314 family protein [Gimesia panareensis]QDT24775.1 hypothetical protein Enr10x_00660 [Gimesia panareensis]
MSATLDLSALWKCLATIKSLTFTAQSFDSGSGWNGTGTGVVKVECINPQTMLFHESGQWSPPNGQVLRFTNVYRWSAFSEQKQLRLEHLRFGITNPVYLFDLQQTSDTQWDSIEPHVCSEDLYTATLSLKDETLHLDWTVKGATKNERISYVYQ